MDESAPLDAAVSVEASSFRWFFEAEYARLCQALYLLTGDPYEAEDLAQEAMTRVLERWDRVGTMESPAGYVYRTAVNLHRKRIRRLMIGARKVFAAPPEDDPSRTVEDQQDVRRALATVPPGEREALVLVDWLEMTADEAAGTLGIDPGAVRVRLHRGRTKLRERLGGAHE